MTRDERESIERELRLGEFMGRADAYVNELGRGYIAAGPAGKDEALFRLMTALREREVMRRQRFSR